MKRINYCFFRVALAAWLACVAAPVLTATHAEELPQQPPAASAEHDPPAADAKTIQADKMAGLQQDFSRLPTYIKADSLTLKTAEQVFIYSGDVEVKQGDMTLTSDSLRGKYNQGNQIETLLAKGNVVITKGESIRASGQTALYDAASETVTLSDGPELQQEESILTADTVKIFLREDRSLAEGQVRVKMVKKSGSGGMSGLISRPK